MHIGYLRKVIDQKVYQEETAMSQLEQSEKDEIVRYYDLLRAIMIKSNLITKDKGKKMS